MTAKPKNASARGDNASGPPQGSNDDYTLHDHLMKRLVLPFVRDEVNKIAALYDAASADTSEMVGRRISHGSCKRRPPSRRWSGSERRTSRLSHARPTQ